MLYSYDQETGTQVAILDYENWEPFSRNDPCCEEHQKGNEVTIPEDTKIEDFCTDQN